MTTIKFNKMASYREKVPWHLAEMAYRTPEAHPKQIYFTSFKKFQNKFMDVYKICVEGLGFLAGAPPLSLSHRR
jgi:hypothetical protein